MEFGFDPVEIGLKVGLEIHQQLSTRAKLFCACPVTKSGELPHSFERMLRPAQSELGHLDPAAVFEFARAKANVYSWSPESSCLVEADEEPPHPLNEEAVDIVLLVAQLLHSNTVDEIHIMRKIVIDGSNTGGFQRTGVIALGGNLSVDGRKVGVQTVTLEEDAARILGEDARARHFALDRLGIPLVEIALDPVTCRPEEVERIALNLGRALRSTGRLARGLGDNQAGPEHLGGRREGGGGEGRSRKLSLLGKVVAYETARQMGMATIADEELKKRGITEKIKVQGGGRLIDGRGLRVEDTPEADQTRGEGECISCGGISGSWAEPFPGITTWQGLAEVARAGSLGGIIHSDEFRKQGIETKEEEALRRALGAARKDRSIIVAGEPAKVDAVIPLLISRLEQTVQGVPAETRAATDDGETKYMRPRPGAQRIYPETDIPEIVVTAERKAMLYRLLPEPWEKNVRRLQEEHSLSPEPALKLYDSEYLEALRRAGGPAQARTVTGRVRPGGPTGPPGAGGARRWRHLRRGLGRDAPSDRRREGREGGSAGHCSPGGQRPSQGRHRGNRDARA